ncbi:hypothetical protein BJX66DRAFT_320769 [Aspergillus keveii]|uniref:Secreted protein n=1 Tax=Aspergillus keveii TaxID=714993 RepID=A0ABR4FH77_9EURO
MMLVRGTVIQSLRLCVFILQAALQVDPTITHVLNIPPNLSRPADGRTVAGRVCILLWSTAAAKVPVPVWLNVKPPPDPLLFDTLSS